MAEATFNPAMHTVEARAEQLDRIFAGNPDAVLVGSTARAAILGEDPSLSKGWRFGVRDIDIATVERETIDLSVEDSMPFPVDIALEGLIRVNQARSIASVQFEAIRPDIQIELPAQVFEPYPVKLAGQKINTFHPDTMRHIHRIYNTGRHKDKASLAYFNNGLVGINYVPIPDKVFEPLDELHELVKKETVLRRQRTIEYWQSVYFDCVPLPVRLATTPILKYIKHRVLGIRGRKSEVQPELLPEDLGELNHQLSA
jgi:hypothetical protein